MLWGGCEVQGTENNHLFIIEIVLEFFALVGDYLQLHSISAEPFFKQCHSHRAGFLVCDGRKLHGLGEGIYVSQDLLLILLVPYQGS